MQAIESAMVSRTPPPCGPHVIDHPIQQLCTKIEGDLRITKKLNHNNLAWRPRAKQARAVTVRSLRTGLYHACFILRNSEPNSSVRIVSTAA